MSIALMTAAWALDIKPTDKLVLLALADWANESDGGRCWPSIKKLCERSSLCERAVQSALNRLCDGDHIHRQMNAGKGTNYYVHPRIKCTPANAAPPHDMHLTPALNAPNTLGTVSKDKKATPPYPSAKAKPAFVLPDCISPDAWAGFLEMRKRKRANPTERAKQLIIDKLAKLSPDGSDCNAILDQSTEHGWTGVFKLKEEHNGQHGSMGRTRSNPNSIASIVRDLVAEAYADEAESPSESDGNNRGPWAEISRRAIQ